jgi:PAS domain S-box-containing protein
VRTDSHKTDAQLEVLIESIRDYAVLLLDSAGIITSWNRGAELIKGYRADEVIGRHFSLFYTEEDRIRGMPQLLLDRARVEERVEQEAWRVRKDGSRFWADVVVTALRDDRGRLTGFGKVTRDLSARREAEGALRQSEQRFRLLVEEVKDYALFMLDPDGRVVTWNAGAERLKGYRASEIIGEHVSRFYDPGERDAGKWKREVEAVLRDGRFEEEGWRLRKDGTRFWANVVLTPLRDARGALLGFAKLTRDLTERRKLEEERIRLAQAREAIRLRDEFLSIASHELKTPLTALHLQLHSLRQRVKDHDQQVLQKVERANQSADRLSTLIETLLDVTRISSGRITISPEPFDLAEAVRQVVESLGPSAAKAGCRVRIATEEVVGSWDRLRIEQILTNLLSNALKYAAGTPIQVSLEKLDGYAVLSIRDQGPGIAHDDLTRIFDRFERGTASRPQGGLGLGLYVSRELVQLHGGTISARNLPEGGACFDVRLPLPNS